MEGHLEHSQGTEEWVPAGLEPRPTAPSVTDDDWVPPPTQRPRARGVPRSPVVNGHPPGQPVLDLNDATFEALRASGLSITQANRFISQREQLGGFRSLDQVEGLTGFPADLKLMLRRHGRV